MSNAEHHRLSERARLLEETKIGRHRHNLRLGQTSAIGSMMAELSGLAGS